MKVLVTGSEGQVARVIAKQLSDKYHLYCFDKNKLDITCKSSVEAAIELIQPDIIINTAAYTAVDKAESEMDSAFNVNSEGVKNLAQVSKEYNCVLIHLSTDYVYDGSMLGYHSENDKLNPETVYGKSKLLAEQYIDEFCEKYIIIRTSWLFSEYGNNFLKTIIKLLKSKSEISVVNDQFGSPTSCYSLVAFIDSVIKGINNSKGQNVWGVYNYCDYPDTNWYDFSLFIEKTLTKDKKSIIKPINSEQYKTQIKRPHNSRLDCKKATEVFKIKSHNWKLEVENIIDCLNR